MNERELKGLGRLDLLEMMLEISKENEQLKIQLKEAQKKLANRSIAIEKAGSIAEASLQLGGVFEAAQEACDLYVTNMQTHIAACKKRCAVMEEKTQERCDNMLEDARQQCDKIWEDLNAKVKELSGEELNVRELVEQSLKKKD